MKTNIQFLAIILLSAFAISCTNEGKPAGFDYGKVENNKYVNSFFDFEMNIPEGWSVQSREQTENLTKIGRDMVAGGNSKINEVLDASEVNSANLLAAFKYDLKTAVQYNPNLMLVAENLQAAPQIKTGADYLANTRNFLKQSQMPHEHIDGMSRQTIINGKDFHSMNVIVNYMGIKIHQTYFATIHKGFCVVATISFTNDGEKKELLDALKTMTFKS